MKWQDRRRSSNIEDRRGQGGGFSPRPGGGLGGVRIPTGGAAGGGLGGIGLLIVIGIVLFAMGINPLDMLSGGGTTSGPTTQFDTSEMPPASGAGQDELAQFVGVVVAETEDLWNQQFQAANLGDYPEPTVVLFSGNTQTGCGLADSAMGPFYCPADQQVYIDLSFYDELRSQFGAPGDFAQAYVIAHEVGHHIQELTGVLPEFNAARPRLSEAEANAWSVRVELQADCYAGVWANYAGQEDLLESGDIEEALNAAIAIGDDTLQERMQGYAVPKTFTHGTSQQRRDWFERGYRSGEPADCDTFASGAV